MLMKLRKVLPLAGLLVGLSAAHAGASETVSTSTDPSALVGSQLNRLMMNEREALSGISDGYLNHITSSLKPSPRPENLGKEISYTRKWVAAQPKASGGSDWECLSDALYFEARGESVKGQFAVAEVIMNRVESSAYPDSVCAVISQGTGKKYQCQFTFTCDGNAEVIHEKRAYVNVGKVARAVLDASELNLTDGATHYHTKAVSPSWARKFPRTATIGVHHFYRQPVRVSKR